MRDMVERLTKPETSTRNPDDPATFNTERWASEILTALQDLKGLDLNLDETRRVLVKIPATNTDYIPVTFDQPAEYVYIPSLPVSLSIHFGTGPGQFIGTFAAGDAVNFRFPRIDALTFVPSSSASASQFDLWYSTRPIDFPSASILSSLSVAGTTGALAVAALAATGASDGLATTPRVMIDVNGNGSIPIVAPFLFNGATWDRTRTAFVFKPIAPVAVVAGTGQTVWTPTAGKKFRLMGWSLSTSVAGEIIFGDNAIATIIYRTGLLTAATSYDSPPSIGNGMLSAAINNVLKIDVTVNGTVQGTVFGTEE